VSAQAELPIEEPTLLENFRASIAGVFAKEARWRMRGRRAFVVVTIYLALLGILVLGVYRLISERAAFDAGFIGGFNERPMPVPTDVVSASVSTEIGQAVFITILIFQTLLTVMLAPALTSGAVAMEREKQTLDMLITTPVSTIGIVLGKLVSSLAFLLLLICGSLPLMAIVFTLGGIAPDDVVRAYLLLFVTAFGLGSIGLFMSALVKRTQMATAISFVIVLILALGSLAIHTYILAAQTRPFFDPESEPRTAPEALLWLNPFVADVDLLCTALPNTGGGPCSYIATVTGIELDPVRPARDSFWPRSMAAFIVLGVTLTLLTTQLIAPSRRFRRTRTPPPTAGFAGGQPGMDNPRSATTRDDGGGQPADG